MVRARARACVRVCLLCVFNRRLLFRCGGAGDGSSGSPTSGSDPETSHEDDTVLGAINFLDLDDMDDMVRHDLWAGMAVGFGWCSVGGVSFMPDDSCTTSPLFPFFTPSPGFSILLANTMIGWGGL